MDNTQSTSGSSDTYMRKKDNDLTLGPAYEDAVLLHSFLTLEDSRALARELAEAAKFDDVVIRATNEQSRQQEYYCFQLKHKDTEKNSEQSIAWNDLLGNDKRNAFCLKQYFDSYIKLNQKAKSNKIKELSIMTTVGFAKKQPEASPTSVSDLVAIATSLADQASKRPAAPAAATQSQLDGVTVRVKYNVTHGDIAEYFDEPENTGGISRIPGKRYKFSQKGMDDVKTSLVSTSAIKQQNEKDFEAFLALLVFHTEASHLNQLTTINQSLLKIFFPFHWDACRQEQCYQEIKENVVELFKPIVSGSSNNVLGKWATVGDRKTIFERLMPAFKKDVSLGSTGGYEINVLLPIYKQLNLDLVSEDQLNEMAPWANIFGEKTLTESEASTNDSNISPIVNIFGEKSNATVIALKILRTIRNLPMEHKTLIVQVNGEEGIQNITNHFNELNKEITMLADRYKALVRDERFCFVIEVSPHFKQVEETNVRILTNLIQSLTKSIDLGKWIQFVIVTQLPVDAIATLNTSQDSPLNWTHLPDAARKYLLFEKTIFLVSDIKKTSLAALRLKDETIGDWMDPVSLAELITHDESRPLCLRLPKYDVDLEAMYVDRKIKIPLLNTHGMSQDLKHRLVYNEEDFNRVTTQSASANNAPRIYHLLKPIDSSTGGFYYLWSKSKDTGTRRDDFDELERYVERAKYSNYEIDESQLLMEESVTFGVGSKDNKLLIVVDLPGKGKTSLLTRLTNQFLRGQRASEKLNKLILRINLLEVKALTWEKSSSSTDMIESEEAAVNFLIGSLPSSISNKTTASFDSTITSLSQAIIKQMCIGTNSMTASVYLLLDGFDEVNEDQRAILFKLVDRLLLAANGIKRIILTSRPDNGLEAKLEEHFKQFALHLRSFTEQDQINFLVKRWNTKLREEQGDIASQQGSLIDENEATDDWMRKYAKELVKYSQRALSDRDRSFLDIPLQCMIVSECFFNGMKLYLRKCQENNLSDSNNLPEFQDGSWDLLRLYSIFYETKISVLLNQKARLQMDDNDASIFIMKQLKRTFSGAVSRLSVFHVMRDTSDAQLLCRMSWSAYRDSKYGEDLEQARRLGLIQGLDDSRSAIEKLDAPHVKFIHRTFAEYFFATFLLDNFVQNESCLLDSVTLPGADGLIADATCKLLTEKILIETQYAGVRRFFERMLANHTPPGGEMCPFAEKKRTSVMKEWPVTSHIKFNTHVAQSLMQCLCLPTFDEWKNKDTGRFESGKMLNKDILVAALETLDSKPEGALLNLLVDKTHKMASPLLTLLLHCVKEYASRPDVSCNERETLTHCVTLISIVWAFHDSSAEVSNIINKTRDEKLSSFCSGSIHR